MYDANPAASSATALPPETRALPGACVLAVDDDEINREIMADFLQRLECRVLLANSGPDALELMAEGVDLVLLDVMMPGMDGFAVAQTMRENPRLRDIPVIMVTTLNSSEERLRAVACGAADFITKPFDLLELRIRLRAQLERKAAVDALKQQRRYLQRQVHERTLSLEQSLEQLQQMRRESEEAQLEAFYCLSNAMKSRNFETYEHIQRMSLLSGAIAKLAGLPEREVRLITQASPLHDLGKMCIPDEILNKPGPLDQAEWQVMRRHSELGAAILGSARSELLCVGRAIALTHHERWDGAGYPNGLAGEEIPVAGRVCCLADSIDAMLSERPYKKALSCEQVLVELEAQSGRQFDPWLTGLVLAHPEILTQGRSACDSA